MKKIMDNVFVFLLGSMFGILMTFLMMKTVMIDIDTARQDGYKQAQRECVQLIKNTK